MGAENLTGHLSLKQNVGGGGVARNNWYYAMLRP